jgi:hypothetical protein
VQGFDIFSGQLEQNPMWIEFAHSLDEARDRMKERARSSPGPYFVYCCETRKVVESIDTSEVSGTRSPHAA